MAGEVSRKLQGAFLEASSRHLAISSPSTSAHLMTERLALTSESPGTTTKGLRHNVCNACGTVMILGWNATTGKELKARNAKQKRERKTHRIYTQVCQRCYRETVTSLAVKMNAAKAFQKPESRATTTTEPAIEIPPTASNRAAEKMSSKQRAKARKDRSGLEALLNKSKQNTGSSSTFNLMDFMKE